MGNRVYFPMNGVLYMSNDMNRHRNDVILFTLMAIAGTVVAFSLDTIPAVKMILWGIVALAALAAIVTMPLAWQDIRRTRPLKREHSDVEPPGWLDDGY